MRADVTPVVSARQLRYHQLRYWSPMVGAQVARLWIFDERGAEYFSIVPMNGTGRENRGMRERALEAIEQAILDGDEPGEVKVEQ